MNTKSQDQDHTRHKTRFIRSALKQKDFSTLALPNDASARKYERITSTDGQFILMDASQEKATLRPFILIADFLQKHGYSAPKVLAKEEERGLLLLEDLGTNSYKYLLESATGHSTQETERKLYKAAIDLLIDLHKNESLHEVSIPSYKKNILLDEVVLLIDWYFPSLTGSHISEDLRKEYIKAWEKILDCIHYSEECLVLQDYHIDNLIWLDDREGLKKIGLLDFQDAKKGSYAYDIVSLLEDARRNVDSNLAKEMLEYYITQIKNLDQKKFLSDYKILGVQRSCKVVGVFSRKATRDNDRRYLKHLPRVWTYIKKGIDHPILEPLKIWFQKADIPVMKNET